MQAEAAHRAEVGKANALPGQASSDPFQPSTRATSSRVGDALLTMGSGPIDPTFRLLAQAEVAYSDD